MKLYYYKALVYVLSWLCYNAYQINSRLAFWCSDTRKLINKIYQARCWHLRLHNRPSLLREGELDFMCPDCKLFETGKILKVNRKV